MNADDDRIRQQREIDAETSASGEAMLRALGAARDHSLNCRAAVLDDREQWLDDREAELDERAAAQGRREGILLQRQRDVDERDRLADQREINAQTTLPGNETDAAPTKVTR